LWVGFELDCPLISCGVAQGDSNVAAVSVAQNLKVGLHALKRSLIRKQYVHQLTRVGIVFVAGCTRRHVSR
jgi:hypothetical protein